MAMVRKQIYLTQELDDKVKQLAKARNVPEAEIIRAALEQYGEYRVAGSQAPLAVRETATLEYGAHVMEGNEKDRIASAARRGLDYEAGLRVLERAKKRAEEVAGTEGGGRTWTREDLYDERPKYLSR